ncbi:MAG: hypothetical protein M0027_14440 [Candidatus Dormibacteraeota bacterium]|nr:hypothetical protein [Candidatus Dormibacteraeota bacterium]
MSIGRNRRLTLVLSAIGVVGAAAALAIGASYALFSSAATPQTSTISAATVTLTNTGSANASSCNFSDIVPGQSLGSTCTYTVDYTGTAPAWLLLNVSTESKAGTPGGSPLIGGAYGLVPTISTPAASEYGIGTQLFGWGTPSASNCSTAQTAAGWQACSSDDNQVVDLWNPTSGGSFTFTISGAMNIGTPAQNNPYQGGSASISVDAWAVQSVNDTNNSGHAPEYPTGPIFESVTSPSATTLNVGYNVPVQVFNTNNYTPSAPSEFSATDVTQSTATTPDVCQYSITTPSPLPAFGSNVASAAVSTLGLTVSSCTGAMPKAGDVLNFTYNVYANASYVVYKAGANPSDLTSNDDFPQQGETFWNITVG